MKSISYGRDLSWIEMDTITGGRIGNTILNLVLKNISKVKNQEVRLIQVFRFEHGTAPIGVYLICSEQVTLSLT